MSAPEDVLFKGGANHFSNGEAAGGWLYLTAGKLYFESHPINKQPHVLEIRLSQIQAVETVNTLGIVPNGLRILLRDYAPEQFVVTKRKEWIYEIERAMAYQPEHKMID